MATKKKNDTVYSPDGTEKSIFAALKKITKTDCEAYFILWKYAPELLPNYENIHSFEDLTNTYKMFKPELSICLNAWMEKEILSY